MSLALTGVVAGIVPAGADDGFGDVTCGQDPSAACELDAGKGTQPPRGRGDTPIRTTGDDQDSGNDGPECRYVPVDYQDPSGQQRGPGAWYMVLCSPDGKDPFSHGPVFVPTGADGAAVLSAEELGRIARARLRLPAPTLAASPAGEVLVHLPTWLWIVGGWAAVSATASVPGVAVTAVATPMWVSWSMGDGGAVRCSGPGTAFPAGADPMAVSPDCGYTYRGSSAQQPGQVYAVSATVHWSVTWSGAGQSGTFPDLITTGNRVVRVAEAPALNLGSR